MVESRLLFQSRHPVAIRAQYRERYGYRIGYGRHCQHGSRFYMMAPEFLEIYVGQQV